MNRSPAGVHLLDTSIVILLMRHRRIASPDALVPFAALGELTTGVFRSNDPVKGSERIFRTIAPATIVHSTDETAFHYGRIIAHLQRIGLPIPPNDVWNAALALEHDVPLLGDDAHFRRVPGLHLIPVR